MKLPLKGIIPPLVTPLTDNRTLDIKGLEKLVEHSLAGGVHALFILGTTGEAASLNYGLRREMIRRTVGLVNGRVPVLAGITDTSFNDSVELAGYSSAIGIDAVVVAPPYYLPISQSEMMDYLENLVPRLALPFLIYDMPGCTKLHMSAGTIRKAKELGAVGVKDSSGDMDNTRLLIEEFRDSAEFSVITGTELHLPETIFSGGHGAVPGGANIYPGLFVNFYNACVERDGLKIEALLKAVRMINETIYKSGTSISEVIKGIKCALSVLDICSDYVAFPLRSCSADDVKKIQLFMKDFEHKLHLKELHI